MIKQEQAKRTYNFGKPKVKTESISAPLDIVDNRINYFEMMIDELNLLRNELQNHEIKQISTGSNLRARTSTPNPFFFLFKNHEELFHLGQQFQTDIESEKRFFAFLPTESKELQEISILGLASYLNYQHHHNVLILSHGRSNSILKKIDSEGSDVVISAKENDLIVTSECNGVALFDLDDLEFCSIEKAQLMLNVLLNHYSVILFDLELINDAPSKFPYYFYLFNLIDNVSIVVHENQTTFSKIVKMNDVITKFNIELKGLIWSDLALDMMGKEGVNEKK